MPRTPCTDRQFPRTPLTGHHLPRTPHTGHHLPRTPHTGHLSPRTPHTGHLSPRTPPTGHQLPRTPLIDCKLSQMPRTPLKTISSQKYSSLSSNEINASVPKATIASNSRTRTTSAETRSPQTITKLEPSPYNSMTQSSPASHKTKTKLSTPKTRTGPIPFRNKTNPSQDGIKPILSTGTAKIKYYIPTGRQIPRTPESVEKVCQIHSSGSLTSQVTGDTCNTGTSNDDQAIGLNSPMAAGTLVEEPCMEQDEYGSSKDCPLHLSSLAATYKTPGRELTDPIYKQPVKSPAENTAYLLATPSVSQNSETAIQETSIVTQEDSLHVEETLSTNISGLKPKVNENTLLDTNTCHVKQERQKSPRKVLTVVEWLKQDKCLNLFGSEDEHVNTSVKYEHVNTSVKDEHINTKHRVEPLTSVSSSLSTTQEPSTPLLCIDSVAELEALHVLSPPTEYKDRVDNSEMENLDKQLMKEKELDFLSDIGLVSSGEKHIPHKINFDESLLNEVPVKIANHKNIKKSNESPLKMCEAEESGSNIMDRKSMKLHLPSTSIMDSSDQIVSKATVNTYTIRNACSESSSMSPEISTNQMYCMEYVEVSKSSSEETIEQLKDLDVSNKRTTSFTHEKGGLKQESHMGAEKESRGQSASEEEKSLGSFTASDIDISYNINDSLEIFTKNRKNRKDKSTMKRSSKTNVQWKTPLNKTKDKKDDYSEDDKGHLRHSYDKRVKKNDIENLEVDCVQHTNEKNWTKADVGHQNSENDCASLTVANMVTTRKRESARRGTGRRNEISAQGSAVMDKSVTKKKPLCNEGEDKIKKVSNDKEESKVDEVHVSKIDTNNLIIDLSIEEESKIQVDKMNEITKAETEESIISNKNWKAKKVQPKKKQGKKMASENVGKSEVEPVAEAAKTSKYQNLQDVSFKMAGEVCEDTRSKKLTLTEIEYKKVSKMMYEVYESTKQDGLDKEHFQRSKQCDELVEYINSEQVSVAKTAKASASQIKRESGKSNQRKEICTEEFEEENQIDKYPSQYVSSRKKKASRNNIETDSKRIVSNMSQGNPSSSSETKEKGTRKTKVIGSAIIPQTINPKYLLTADGIHADGEHIEENLISESANKKGKTRKQTANKRLVEHNESAVIRSQVLLETARATSTGIQSDPEGSGMKLKVAKEHPQEPSETINIFKKQDKVRSNTGYTSNTSDDAFLEFASKASRKMNLMQPDDVNSTLVVHEELESSVPKDISDSIPKRRGRSRKKEPIESRGMSAAVCHKVPISVVTERDLNDTWSISPIMKLPHKVRHKKADCDLHEKQKEQDDNLKDERKKNVEVDLEERKTEKDFALEQGREEMDINVENELKKGSTVLEGGKKKQVHPEAAQIKKVGTRKGCGKRKQNKANTQPHETDDVDSNSILVNEGKLEKDNDGNENQVEGCTVKMDKERGGKKSKRGRKNDNQEKESSSRKCEKSKKVEQTLVTGEQKPTRGAHKKRNTTKVKESADKENDELYIKATNKRSHVGVKAKRNSKATKESSSCKSEQGHNLKINKKCSEKGALVYGSSALISGRSSGRKCKAKAMEAISNILNQSDDAVFVGTKRF